VRAAPWGSWAVAIDGNDQVWSSNFAGASITHLCGVRTKMKTGDPISPPGGYVGRPAIAEAFLANVLATNFSWCAEWEGELKKLFANYVEAKQRQNVLDYDDLLLYWAQ
jgi:superfamily I DNA/RNA helicase